MLDRLVFPNHSFTHLQLTVAQFRAAHRSETIDTIDLHVLYGGGGCSDPGTSVKISRLAAFGRFVSKHASSIGLKKGDKRKSRCDQAGRRTTCAIWLT